METVHNRGKYGACQPWQPRRVRWSITTSSLCFPDHYYLLRDNDTSASAARSPALDTRRCVAQHGFDPIPGRNASAGPDALLSDGVTA